MTEPAKATQPGSARATHGGNLYHKQKKSPRSRRDTAHRMDSGLPPSPRRDANPLKATLVNNVKKFVFFTIAMTGILFVSIKALNMIWAIRDQEIFSSPSPPLPLSAGTETNLAPTTEAATGTAQVTRSELDTEAIRKAVFLAKRAKTLQASGQFIDAIARYKEALDVWPYLTQVWADLGRLYMQTKDFPKAQIALEKAVENNPGSATILNDLGVTYLYLRQPDRAMKVFETAIEIDPNYVASYFNSALGHLARGDKDQARAFLERYLRLKPNEPRALRELAFLDASAGHYDVALKALERAIVEAPDWPLLYFDASAASALMGRGDEAIRYLEKAEPLSSPAVVYRLYQEAAFREIRLSEIGKEFEANLAEKARAIVAAKGEPPPISNVSEPISSVSEAP